MIDSKVQKILKSSDERRTQLHRQLLRGTIRKEQYRRLLRQEKRAVNKALADVHDFAR